MYSTEEGKALKVRWIIKKKRLKEHNSGRITSTKHRRPFKLIYFEGCLNEQDAKAREKYLKSGMGKRYVRNRLKIYFGQN